jgi:hypothetical protein
VKEWTGWASKVEEAKVAEEMHNEYVQSIIKEYGENKKKVEEKRQVQKNATVEEVFFFFFFFFPPIYSPLWRTICKRLNMYVVVSMWLVSCLVCFFVICIEVHIVSL